jgi:hypothetical protein
VLRLAMRPVGSRALSSSALADLLERTRGEAERVRSGTAAAATTGLLSAVASASSGTLADSVNVLMRRRDTRGKPLTAANQWRRYCRDKQVAPWPVTLPKLQGYLVWRLATETRSSGRLFKASGSAAAVSWLKRYALARGIWELTVAEEALLARVQRVVPMHVPASRTSTRVLSTAELVRLVRAMRLAPPSAHLRLARAVLALAVTLQSRWTELRRARMRDFVAAPEGVVVSVVFGKVAGNRSEIPRHLIFGPHLAGELASCARGLRTRPSHRVICRATRPPGTTTATCTLTVRFSACWQARSWLLRHCPPPPLCRALRAGQTLVVFKTPVDRSVAFKTPV